MKKLSGISLVEILMTLCVLGLVIPASLSAFGIVFMAELRIHEHVEKAESAEWWFNQLNFPVHVPDLNDAPQSHGRMHFTWESRLGDHGALHITLHVTNRAPLDVPLTVSRVY